MKQSAFWREKNGEYKACFKCSIPTFVEWIYKMQRLEVSSAVRLLYRSLGVKGHAIKILPALETIPTATKVSFLPPQQCWETVLKFSKVQWIEFVFLTANLETFFIRSLQLQLFLYLPRDSGHIYPPYNWQSLYWQHVTTWSECLVNIDENCVFFVRQCYLITTNVT